MLYLIAGAVAVYAAYQYFFADDRDDRPPSRPRTYKSSQPPVHRLDERQQGQSIDSSHRDHITQEEAYASLRARAKQEGDLMAQCYQQSKEAYERRDRARAKALSDEGKRHALKMETLNADASATIFKDVTPLLHNAQDRDACEVDLHGLFVKEAIAYSEKAVSAARRSGYSEIHLIVGMCISSARSEAPSSNLVFPWPLAGQGNHSEKGIPRLKPALQEDMQKRGHHVEADPKNPGVLVVRLGGR
ncbi:hypothetical protein JVT61DRAFT_2939 [Boletus reticuloceps]|uniref:DUF1771 domain-containing protein n=1 Tax=Boletus reticuloceps TaxID=495285 RepID=A0A8I3A832_9AGAM|nr:hypothetical protein JVT61DRAFT_2939 [Boletus reticuloceps]